MFPPPFSVFKRRTASPLLIQTPPSQVLLSVLTARMRSLHITFHGEKSWAQGEGTVRRRVHAPHVSLPVNARLCYTVERKCGCHEFINASQLEERLVHSKPCLSCDSQDYVADTTGRPRGLCTSSTVSVPSLVLTVRMSFPSPPSAQPPPSRGPV